MSEPLDHLLSVDFGESSPQSDVFEDGNKTQVLSTSKKPIKKVRFADMCSQRAEDVVLKKLVSESKTEESACRSNIKEVKGILKVIATARYGGVGSLKGWSRPSPTVPVTVNIVSSMEDKNCTKSNDILSENITGKKNDKCDPVSAAVNADNMLGDNRVLGTGDSMKNDELSEHDLNLSSPAPVEDSKHELFQVEGNEGCLSKTESGVELQLGKLEISQTDENVLEEINGEVQIPCDKIIEHNFNSGQYLLVDEIRKMSKELFIKSANHCEDIKSSDFNESIKSEVLADTSFISKDIVNDILDTQCGRGKLVFQETENLEMTAETYSKTEKRVASDDTVKNAESSGVKLDVSSRVKRPSSPHTLRLKRMLEEIVPEKPTAKDLRTIAFSAWCAIKADEKKSLTKKLKNVEKQFQVSTMKDKSLKEASAVKAFMCWKEQKEKTLKLKKENDMKVAETKSSKAQEDRKKNKEEADLVFKAWKKKKDEELKEQLRKQKLKTKKEALNKGQSEEEKKLDAAAAFNAWKSQKSLELLRKEKECHIKKELETSLKAKEKSERDKEAIKAYELWLEYKELHEDGYDWRNQLESKPPWSPPGRIA